MTPTKEKQVTRPRFNLKAFLTKVGAGRTLGEHRANQIIYSQDDAADSIIYTHKGKVKLTVVSRVGYAGEAS